MTLSLSKDSNGRMDPEKRDEWIRRLESGEYPQTQARLVNSQHWTDEGEKKNAYCCWGVLCEMAVEDPESGIERDPEHHEYFRDQHGNRMWAYPTAAVLEWAGIPPQVNLDGEPIEHTHVAQMNDTGFEFPQIAEWIRTNW